MIEPEAVQLRAAHGITGDRHAARPGSKRQVSLIQWEHLEVIAALIGRAIPPHLLRRNLALSGINLMALNGQIFRIGETVLEGAGPCHPCSKMEQVLGLGGYNAMRGHGGLVARIVEGGIIRIGDRVDLA